MMCGYRNGDPLEAAGYRPERGRTIVLNGLPFIGWVNITRAHDDVTKLYYSCSSDDLLAQWDKATDACFFNIYWSVVKEIYDTDCDIGNPDVWKQTTVKTVARMRLDRWYFEMSNCGHSTKRVLPPLFGYAMRLDDLGLVQCSEYEDWDVPVVPDPGLPTWPSTPQGEDPTPARTVTTCRVIIAQSAEAYTNWQGNVVAADFRADAVILCPPGTPVQATLVMNTLSTHRGKRNSSYVYRSTYNRVGQAQSAYEFYLRFGIEI